MSFEDEDSCQIINSHLLLDTVKLPSENYAEVTVGEFRSYHRKRHLSFECYGEKKVLKNDGSCTVEKLPLKNEC
jgi:hypothetical protein